jgi:hypothetical protein
MYRLDLCNATLFKEMAVSEVSLTSRFKPGRAESVLDRENPGVRLCDALFSSVSTRSSVARGLRTPDRCIVVPGFWANWDELAALTRGGRIGDGVLGPPSFRRSILEVSGRRLP